MLASLLIVFREVFEAGLIVGIVLAATKGIPYRGRWIVGGIAAGVAGAALIAYFANALFSSFEGSGQEVFTAIVLILAVFMLSWHILWMAKHGREMAQELKAVGQAVSAGQKSLFALATVVGLAVLREGAEVVLFMYGIATSAASSPATMITGGLAGIALGGFVSFLLYRGLLAIPVRWLFSVTNAMIALLAAGMAGQAAATLANIDYIPSWGYELWDSSWLLPQDSLLGVTLQSLIGYADRPMGVQSAAWVVVLLSLLAASRLTQPNRPRALPQAA